METTVKFAKVKEGAIIPSKRDEDMGFDIYACFDELYIDIEPHETKLIPTGIASCCDSGYGFILRERSSTGPKGISLRSGVIDSGYRGEWFVCLTNTADEVLVISKLDKMSTACCLCGCDEEDFMLPEDEVDACMIYYPYSKAIAQALVIPVPKVIVEEIDHEELQQISSERGVGALGSSNK